MEVVQLAVGGFDNNLSYLIIGDNSEGFLIDATGSKEVIESALKEHKVHLVAQLLTHSHPDHCELVDYFSKKEVVLISFKELLAQPFSQKEITLAGISLIVIATPGHLHDAVCFIIGNNLITGDTLFVRGVGTTAYGGNERELEETLAFLSTLDPSLRILPGHNYGGTHATLKDALDNSHIRPSPRVLELIKKKVLEYEKKHGKKY